MAVPRHWKAGPVTVPSLPGPLVLWVEEKTRNVGCQLVGFCKEGRFYSSPQTLEGRSGYRAWLTLSPGPIGGREYQKSGMCDSHREGGSIVVPRQFPGTGRQAQIQGPVYVFLCSCWWKRRTGI